jgi:hypothetical protein
LAVDRLSRDGRLRLRHPARVGFHLTLASPECDESPVKVG